jgi:hypothetical protein
MFGRALFALVWLIIAAGVALPLYSRDVPGSTVAAATDSVQLAAGIDAFGCDECPVPDGGRADCRCDGAQAAVFVPLGEPVGLTIAVVVRPQASEPPARLPAKLPAI